jgi:hypothetical protein
MRKRRRRLLDIPNYFLIPIALTPKEIDEVLYIYNSTRGVIGKSEVHSREIWDACVHCFMASSVTNIYNAFKKKNTDIVSWLF